MSFWNKVFGFAVAMMFTTALFSQIPASEDVEAKDGIAKLIDSFQADDVDAIAECFRFPFHRAYPIPAIHSKEEFVRRFEEVFDEEISRKIKTSRIEEDWTEMGWRGYMLFNGLVWIDYDGKVKGINYFSAKERRIRGDLITKDRGTIYRGLQGFEAPVLKWDTESVTLRIDELEGDFRLGIWEVGESFSRAPERVISHGTVVYEGSGGNHCYKFKQDETLYECWVEVLGGESEYGIGSLTIQEHGVRVLQEEASRSY